MAGCKYSYYMKIWNIIKMADIWKLIIVFKIFIVSFRAIYFSKTNILILFVHFLTYHVYKP